MRSVEQRLRVLRGGQDLNYAQNLAYIRKRSDMPGGLSSYGTDEAELNALEKQYALSDATRCLESLRARVLVWIGHQTSFDPALRLQGLLAAGKVACEEVGVTSEQLEELYRSWQVTKVGIRHRKEGRWRNSGYQMVPT